MFSAGGAGNLFLFDEVHHLLLAPGVHASFQRNVVLSAVVFDHFVRAESFVAFTAVHQRIGEASQMAGRHPCLGVHEDRTVYAYVIGGFLHEFLPPDFFDIVFQLHAKIAVIPGIGQAPVDLAAGVDKASRFGKVDDLIHCFFHVFSSPFLLGCVKALFLIIPSGKTVFNSKVYPSRMAGQVHVPLHIISRISRLLKRLSVFRRV